MSRVGKRIIILPEGVQVAVAGNTVTVKGPKGELSKDFFDTIKVNVTDNELTTERLNENKQTVMIHGTTNSLIQGMVTGVSEGFKKDLLIKGVGYNVVLQGNKLVFSLGKSHKDEKEIPEGLKAEVTSPTEFTISGIDKQQVGEFAAVCKHLRKPEPYGGKGIMYKGEHIRRKAGKVAK
jgi:large subunit ribosomal protein L6